MSLDSKLDEAIGKTVWIWLPFYALFHLIQKFGEHRKNKDHASH